MTAVPALHEDEGTTSPPSPTKSDVGDPASSSPRGGEGGRRERSNAFAPRAALTIVLVLALGIRLWGLDWQLPWQFHPDEGHYTWKAMELIERDNPNPRYFRNPSLFTYLLLGEYTLLGFQAAKAGQGTLADQEESRDDLLRPPSGVAFVGRLTSALMGVATVGTVGWIGWRVLGPWGGVLSALFLGLSYIHVRDSHYATNDVPAAFLLTLSVAASLSILRHPTWRAYLLAGLFGGLATSTKYNAGLFVAPLLAAHAVVVWRAWRREVDAQAPDACHEAIGAPRYAEDYGSPVNSSVIPSAARDLCTEPNSPAGWSVRRSFAALRMTTVGADGELARSHLIVLTILPLALAGLLSLAAYLAGTPYTILDFPKFWADFRTQASFVREGWEGQATLPPGVPYLLALGQGMGWVTLGLALVGLALLARRAPARALVLAAYPAAYLLFMLRSELFFVRFALPVVPFLCVLAACGVVLLARMAGEQVHQWSRSDLASDRRGWAALVGAALALAAVVQPTLDSARHNLLIAQEDTRVLATRWAVENVRPGDKLLVEEYTLRDRVPRAYGGPVWRLDMDELDVNGLSRTDPLAPLRGSARYVVVSSFQYERFGRGAGRSERQGAFYDALDRDWRLVAQFAPGHGSTPLPFDLEELYTPFADLGRYERPGPTIKVYERK